MICIYYVFCEYKSGMWVLHTIHGYCANMYRVFWRIYFEQCGGNARTLRGLGGGADYVYVRQL